jgi:hypothetical protein
MDAVRQGWCTIGSKKKKSYWISMKSCGKTSSHSNFFTKKIKYFTGQQNNG